MHLDDPVIRFFKGPTGHRVAYARHGTGPLLVCGAWWVSHLEQDWADPGFRRFFGGLGAHRSVVRYDRPGSGLSDRERARVDLQGEVDTLKALLDELGEAQVDLLGISCGGPPVLTCAATQPERVGRIALIGSYLRGADVGNTELRDALMALVRAHWGVGAATIANLFAPDLGSDAVRRMGKRQRATASAEMAARLVALTFDADAAEMARRVQAPALVLHRRFDRTIPLSAGVELAAALPNASLQTLEGSAHVPWLGDVEEMLRATTSFLTAGEAHDAGPATPAPVPPQAQTPDARWERSGDLWTLSFAGTTVHVKQARGLEDLAKLLSCPDQEIHATALYQGDVHGNLETLGSDPVLDEQAIASFRARLKDFEVGAEEARDRGDVDGAERLLAARDQLAQQLRGATGLGGRRRKLGDAAERARKAVTARVRASIQKIEEVHPQLGSHLRAQVSTGSFCCYRATPDVRWLLD